MNLSAVYENTPGDRQAGFDRRVVVRVVCVAVVITAVFVWAWWQTLVGLAGDWRTDPNYSVGQLVPIAALYLLWTRRRDLAGCPIRPCWLGLVIVLAAQAMRAAGLLFLYESGERYAMILAAAGLLLWVAGRQALKRLAWLPLLLALMIPLPGRVHNAVSGPLQNHATSGAVFMLELSGVPVVQEGATILLDNSVPLAVAEACSGLRMLTAFVVVAAALAIAIQRPRWQKLVLVVSAVPVAIVCNLVRLFVTAHMYMLLGNETAEAFFHDFAGITMMPMAVAMLLGELWLMNKLIVPDPRSTATRAPL